MLCFILLLGNFVNVLAQAASKHLLCEDQIQGNKREIWFLSGFPRGRESEHKLKQQSLGVLAVPPVPSPPAGAGSAAGSGGLDARPSSYFPMAGSVHRQLCSGCVSRGQAKLTFMRLAPQGASSFLCFSLVF